MAIPTVDTFEHDIAEEIRTKEASITDIASAGGNVGNTPQAQTSNLLFILGGFFILAVIGIFIGFFFFYNKKTPDIAPLTATSTQPVVTSPLVNLSATLQDAIGGNVGTVSKNEYGYSIMLTDYSPVFSYMIRNENAYADDLALAVGSPRDTTGTTSVSFTFADVTISNQNMRVGTSGSSTVVYAFVNAEALIISSSTQGILALRGAILK